MRNRTRILLALLAVAVIGAFVWLALRPREPRYAGKSLTEWLTQAGTARVKAALARVEPGTSPDWLAATNALRQIGTNAVPALLRMLEARDSPMMLKLIILAEKQKFIGILYDGSGFTVLGFHCYTTADFLHDHAMDGFRFLGTDASNAVPDLIHIYQAKLAEPPARQPMLLCQAVIGKDLQPTQIRTAVGRALQDTFFTSENPRLSVIHALGSIGPPAKAAVPLLLEAATNSDYRIQFPAMIALGQIHADPQKVAPLFIAALNNPNNNIKVRFIAAAELGQFGTNARSWSPDLVAALRQIKPDDKTLINPETSVRLDELIKTTLQAIDPETAAELADDKKEEEK